MEATSWRPKLRPGKGPSNPKLILIGEAYGAEEAAQDAPFVGRSGKQLDFYLAEAGWSREDCYLTNLVNDRPPGNNIEPIFKEVTGEEAKELKGLGCLVHIHHNWNVKKVRRFALTPLGMEARSFLLNELEAFKPLPLVVTLGNASTLALTGKCGIEKLRGSPFKFKSTWVIPSIHPAYVMRQPLNRYYLVSDLKKLHRYPEPPVRQFALGIAPAQESLPAILENKLIALDIETDSNAKPVAVALASSPTQAVSFPLVGTTGESLRFLQDKLIAALSDPTNEVITHNGIFDSLLLERHFNFKWQARLQDTMVLFRILHPEISYGLDTLASLLTWEPFWKEDGKIAGITGDLRLALEYGAKDASVTFECWNSLKRSLSSKSVRATYERTMEAFPRYREMTHTGIKLDLVARKQLSTDLRAHQDELQVQLNELTKPVLELLRQPNEDALLEYEGLYETAFDVADKATRKAMKLAIKKTSEALDKIPATLNANSSKQLAWWFYQVKKAPPYKNEGKVTVDENALEALAIETSTHPAFPEAPIIRELKLNNKLISTYLDNPIDGDGCWRACWKPVGTTTGRSSSEKTYWGTGGPLQNLHPRLKPMLVARPGYKIVSIDLKGAEWWIASFLSGDKRRIEAFHNGEDPHLVTANAIYKQPITLLQEEDKCIKRLNAEGNAEKVAIARLATGLSGGKLPKGTSCRQAAKKANHGFDRMEGPRKYALDNGVSLAEATTIHKEYLSTYRSLEDWWADTSYKIRKTHSVTSLSNRIWNVKATYSASLLRDCLAFLLQSPIADATTAALVALPVSCRPLIHEHDKLVFEVPDGPQIAPIIAAVSEAITPTYKSPNGDFRLKVDVLIGDSLGTLRPYSDTITS